MGSTLVPATSGCNTVSGTATTSPRLVLTHQASPLTIVTGALTTLTAAFLTDFGGAAVAPSDLVALVAYQRRAALRNVRGNRMSPNEKSARLSAMAVALRKLQKEAIRLDEGVLGFLIAQAVDEAHKAAARSIVRA